ncbi:MULTISPECIES: DNA sulfur modification protein DndB [Corallococcus]|nr:MULTISPECIES: DNA sulfur modification protein DndB [Corallococcus]
MLDYSGGNRFIELRVKRALNLGSNTMVTTVDMGTFLLQSMVGNDPLKGPVTQRKPDMTHAHKMARFIFKGLVNFTSKKWEDAGRKLPTEIENIKTDLGNQPYYAWAPVVASIRDEMSDITVVPIPESAGELILKLRSNQTLWIVDGQHRRLAWGLVRDYLQQVTRDRKYTKSGGLVPAELKQVHEDAAPFWHEAMSYFTERFSITIEIHFGLTIEQEKQLFHDLNNLQKTVSTSQAQAFDQSNPINIFTHRLKSDPMFEGVSIVEEGRVDWDDPQWMKLDSLNAVNARLFLNQTTISGATASVIEREEDAWAFWTAVTKIPGIFDRGQSVAAQPALLKSIARVYFEILWGRKPEGREVAEKFLGRLPTIDFSHGNQLWNIENLGDEKLSHYPKLLDYLPDNWRQKSIGGLIDGKLRFGSRHNESILVLPGIIRYLAELSPRE